MTPASDAGAETLPPRTTASLKAIAEQCDNKASELMKALTKLKVDAGDSSMKRSLKSLGVPLKRNKIKSLQSELEALQHKVELNVVTDIRDYCHRSGQLVIDRLDALGASQKAILLAIANDRINLQVNRMTP